VTDYLTILVKSVDECRWPTCSSKVTLKQNIQNVVVYLYAVCLAVAWRPLCCTAVVSVFYRIFAVHAGCENLNLLLSHSCLGAKRVLLGCLA